MTVLNQYILCMHVGTHKVHICVFVFKSPGRKCVQPFKVNLFVISMGLSTELLIPLPKMSGQTVLSYPSPSLKQAINIMLKNKTKKKKQGEQHCHSWKRNRTFGNWKENRELNEELCKLLTILKKAFYTEDVFACERQLAVIQI